MKYLIAMAMVFVSLQTHAQTKEQDILALSNVKFGYMTAGKLDSLEQLFDDKMLLQHANGMLQTKSEYLGTLRSGMMKYVKVDIKEASATVAGPTAFVIGKCRFDIIFQGKNASFDFGYTEVYTMQNNEWKMALYSVRKLD